MSTATTDKSNVNDNGKKLMEVAKTTAPNKKNGGMNLLRVALFMIRRKSNGKAKSPMQVEVGSKGMWKKIVGSMRPLHLQDNNGSPPHAITAAACDSPVVMEQYEDVYPPPMSPNWPHTPPSPSSSSCDDGMSSRYASAMNLQELDKSDDCDAEINECGDDSMIDAKAEEFIAQFYQQMRLQRLDSINHRYNEMIARGLR